MSYILCNYEIINRPNGNFYVYVYEGTEPIFYESPN